MDATAATLAAPAPALSLRQALLLHAKLLGGATPLFALVGLALAALGQLVGGLMGGFVEAFGAGSAGARGVHLGALAGALMAVVPFLIYLATSTGGVLALGRTTRRVLMLHGVTLFALTPLGFWAVMRSGLLGDLLLALAS